MSHLTREEVDSMGFTSVGDNVIISSRASFHNCAQISIGNHVRIDDFCVLSAGNGGIIIGNYVHIAVYTSLIGRGEILLSDFCNLSSRVSVYSSNDDYSGAFMTNPTVPPEFTRVTSAGVYFGKHVIVGCGSVILPGVVLEEGVAVGALSLVTKKCEAFGIYVGSPARWMKERSRNILELESRFISSNLKNMHLSTKNHA